jgi:hypothetical protein
MGSDRARVLGLFAAGVWCFSSCAGDVQVPRREAWSTLPAAPSTLTLEVRRLDSGVELALRNDDLRIFQGNLCDHGWQQADGGFAMEGERVCNAALFSFPPGQRRAEFFTTPSVPAGSYRAVTVVTDATSAVRVVSQPVQLP